MKKYNTNNNLNISSYNSENLGFAAIESANQDTEFKKGIVHTDTTSNKTYLMVIFEEKFFNTLLNAFKHDKCEFKIVNPDYQQNTRVMVGSFVQIYDEKTIYINYELGDEQKI